MPIRVASGIVRPLVDEMKKWMLLLVLVLSGCGNPQMSRMMPGSMLDVAPKNDSSVLYPEWGEPETPSSQTQATQFRMVEGPYGIRKSDLADSFTYYLSQLGIEHEILPGDHLIIKLKEKVQFTSGSDKVSGESRRWLSQLAAYVSGMPDIDIIIEGHTDNIGNPAVNEKLSQKRAYRVKNELVKQNVSSSSIYTRGYGGYMPKCTNNTRSGRACNRRVELSFVLAN